MPALTKKKTKKRVRSADTGRAKKDDPVARFARDNSSALKALGWVLSHTPGALASKAVASLKKKDSTRVGVSKGMRGSEKKTTKKSRGRK